ncbi:MAG TPA: biotin-independent malonate decarboxylase subunit gamma [Noviherbaspirillum sp.]|nr:biotin-independent malonate decarboxylase subunit gamma [Noviherbaspirillum sp.]
MSQKCILDALFPDGHAVTVTGYALTGEAQTVAGPVAVLGTTAGAAIDHRIALILAAFVLDTVAQHPKRSFVFLVDTCGQALSRSQELLCLNGTLAHLTQCIDLARRHGHSSISLVTANAVSGGFLSFGLMADLVYALADAHVRVMDLRAISRVTKIPHERLVELSATSPVFSPGIENYFRTGGIDGVWEEASAERMVDALAIADEVRLAGDMRMTYGQRRQGRRLAGGIAAKVLGTLS